MACIDKGDIIGSLFLDFRKKFDLVNHNILIKKLSIYKVSNSSLQWFISYLESRQQTIDSGQGMSIRSLIRSGVPQGSILGPILFLLFINDLPLLLNSCHFELFADDATAHTSNQNIEIINAELQSDFSIAVSWSKQNKLPINYDKTTYMVLGAKKRVQDEYQLELSADNHAINKVTKQRLLDIIIDDHLSWTAHIDHLCSTLAAKISLLRQLSAYVPQDVQKMYYQSYILPLLDYGSNTWGTTSCANIERLSKLQKRAARIILKADFFTPSKFMFETLGWLSVPKRLLYNKAILTYKALNNMTPAHITNLLTPISKTQSLSLRSSENGALCIPRSRSALYDRSFSHSASKLWNSLPQNIRKVNSFRSFKTDLRN